MSQPESLTEQQLDEIAGRANSATPGSWGIYEYGSDGSVTDITDEVRRLRRQRTFLLGQLARKDAASGAADAALAAFLGSEVPTEPETATEAPEGRVGDSAHPIADVDNPTPLRWGLDDVLWSDDNSVIVLLSGPDLEPYWLELDADRATVLRQSLAGPHGETEPDAIHLHFGLSYCNYLVLPRTLLQSMPDLWQNEFVALLDQLDTAFRHVPQAERYQVEAATEHIVGEMSDAQLKQAGITEDGYRGETPPEGLSPEDLAEWEAAHEDPEGPTYSRDGEELDRHQRVLIPAVDPIPHYDRGRARIEPQPTA